MLLFQSTRLSARAALLIPKGCSPSCPFCMGENWFIRNQLLNCPRLRDQQQTGTGTLQWHTAAALLKKDTCGFNTPLISARERRGTMDPKAERPGSQRRLLPCTTSHNPKEGKRGSWHRARNICGSLAPCVPHLRNFPNYGAIPGSRRRGFYLN